MTTGVNLAKWDAGLDASRERTLKTVARGDIIITHATGARMVAAWTLVPAPRDPVVHLERAHARARQHLARLTAHDPGREVTSAMTDELFAGSPTGSRAAHGPGRAPAATRTRAQGSPPRARPCARSPNQIDQWSCGAATASSDADRRLGAVDVDAARRPSAAAPADLGRMAWPSTGRALLVRRAADSPPKSSMAAARRRWPSPGPSPRARSEILYRRRWTRPLRRGPQARYAEACSRLARPRRETRRPVTRLSSIRASMASSAPPTGYRGPGLSRASSRPARHDLATGGRHGADEVCCRRRGG